MGAYIAVTVSVYIPIGGRWERERDMAGYLGVATATIRNWRKEKPHLYEIVMKGFAFEEVVKKAQQNADELKALEEQFKGKK